jgi:hypothetical protein
VFAKFGEDMARRESMIFYAKWRDAISELPIAVRNEVQNTILEYGLDGTMPSDIGQTTKAIMTLIKPQIDANNQKYENGCKGGEYGALGGRPRKPQENPNETPEKPQENPNETPIMINDICNINNTLSLSLSQSEKEETEGGVTATERERFFEIFYFRNAKHPAEEVERFINHYEVSGWRRNGSNRKVSNKYALAKSWKFEETTPRYDSVTIGILRKIETACLEIGNTGIAKVLHAYLRKAEITEENKVRFILANKEAMDVIETYKDAIYKHLQCSGIQYSVIRIN